jgi:hypothetical protein
MLTAAIALAVVVIVGFWIAGGVLPRLGGLVTAIFGVLVLAVDRSLAGSSCLPLVCCCGSWGIGLRASSSHLKESACPAHLPATRAQALGPHSRVGLARNDCRALRRTYSRCRASIAAVGLGGRSHTAAQ